MTCCFFGHRDAPDSIAPQLEKMLRQIIEHEGVTRFLVGCQGNFDRMVARILSHLQTEYSHIRCYIVLCYIPEKSNITYPLETLYPEVLANIPKRFAIDKRNRWMLNQSDMVIAYVCSSAGCSARYLSIAEKRQKCCINLAKQPPLDQMPKEYRSIL